MFICYLGKNQRKFFSLRGRHLQEFSFSRLSLLERLFSKRLVVISRENLFYITKTFPLLNKKDLFQAISFEAETLSPYENFRFYFLPQQIDEKNLLVHIWIWDHTLLEKLEQDGFSSTHILPEDLLFQSSENSLFVLKRDNFLYLVALKKGKFLSSTLIPDTQDEIKLYLHTLKNYKPMYVFIYDSPSSIEDKVFYEVFSDSPPLIKRKKGFFEEWPNFFQTLSLGPFKVKREITVSIPEVSFVFLRVLLYLLLALTAYYFASIYSYKLEIKNLETEISSLESKIKSLSTSYQTDNETANLEVKYRELTEELSLKESSRMSRINFLLDRLAEVLPERAFIRSLELRERKVTLNLVAQDVVEILEKLRKIPEIKDLTVPSPPIYDKNINLYSFSVEITL